MHTSISWGVTRQASEEMEAKNKTSDRGMMKGKVTTPYSKYVVNGQSDAAVSMAHPCYQYQVKPSRPVVEVATAAASDATIDDVNVRATAFIRAVRERIRNELKK
jgi:trans-aconitate methyltransferase